jgi:hypothetical protein
MQQIARPTQHSLQLKHVGDAHKYSRKIATTRCENGRCLPRILAIALLLRSPRRAAESWNGWDRSLDRDSFLPRRRRNLPLQFRRMDVTHRPLLKELLVNLGQFLRCRFPAQVCQLNNHFDAVQLP